MIKCQQSKKLGCIDYFVYERHMKGGKGKPFHGSCLCHALSEYYPENDFKAENLNFAVLLISKGCSTEILHESFQSVKKNRFGIILAVTIPSEIFESRF